MDNQMIRELIDGLIKIYENSLTSIILYGSYARGTQSPESDVDIAIIIDRQGTPAQCAALVSFLVDLDLRYDQVLSVVDIESSKFMEWKDVIPFYKNVQNEGVVLWEAA